MMGAPEQSPYRLGHHECVYIGTVATPGLDSSLPAVSPSCGLDRVIRPIPQPAKTLQGKDIGDSYSSHYQSHQRFEHGNRCMVKCRTFARSKARVSFQTMEIRSLGLVRSRPFLAMVRNPGSR